MIDNYSWRHEIRRYGQNFFKYNTVFQTNYSVIIEVEIIVRISESRLLLFTETAELYKETQRQYESAKSAMMYVKEETEINSVKKDIAYSKIEEHAAVCGKIKEECEKYEKII